MAAASKVLTINILQPLIIAALNNNFYIRWDKTS